MLKRWLYATALKFLRYVAHFWAKVWDAATVEAVGTHSDLRAAILIFSEVFGGLYNMIDRIGSGAHLGWRAVNCKHDQSSLLLEAQQ